MNVTASFVSMLSLAMGMLSSRVSPAVSIFLLNRGKASNIDPGDDENGNVNFDFTCHGFVKGGEE
jgi:hypothetical protein